jgi:hypothetical protein
VLAARGTDGRIAARDRGAGVVAPRAIKAQLRARRPGARQRHQAEKKETGKIGEPAYQGAYAHAPLCIASPRAPAQQNVVRCEMPQESWLYARFPFALRGFVSVKRFER